MRQQQHIPPAEPGPVKVHLLRLNWPLLDQHEDAERWCPALHRAGASFPRTVGTTPKGGTFESCGDALARCD